MHFFVTYVTKKCMKLRIEVLELLDRIAWLGGAMMRPTFPNLMGLGPGNRIRDRLSEKHLIENSGPSQGDWVKQLTKKGALVARGGRNPPDEWSSLWDGQWRMLMFDLPAEFSKERTALYRWLRKNCLGCLQRSVWICPHPLDQVRKRLKAKLPDAGSLFFFQGRPEGAGQSADVEISAAAWDFDAINAAYQRHEKLILNYPGMGNETRWSQWKGDEFREWSVAMNCDPLLPKALNPVGYRGYRNWEMRERLISEIRNSKC